MPACLYLDCAIATDPSMSGVATESARSSGRWSLEGSAASLCAVRFCEYAAPALRGDLSLALVHRPDGSGDETTSRGARVCFRAHLSDWSPVLLSDGGGAAELPQAVASVSRPSLRRAEDGVIVSGLGSVLREMVKIAHRADPQFGYDVLLGRKGACLKACAHVSAWTRLCESDLPSFVGNAAAVGLGGTASAALSDCVLKLDRRLGEGYDVRLYVGPRRATQVRRAAELHPPGDEEVDMGDEVEEKEEKKQENASQVPQSSSPPHSPPQQKQLAGRELPRPPLAVALSARRLSDYSVHLLQQLRLEAGDRNRVDGRRFMEGCIPSLVDFIAYTSLQHVLAEVPPSDVSHRLPERLAAWYRRMHAMLPLWELSEAERSALCAGGAAAVMRGQQTQVATVPPTDSPTDLCASAASLSLSTSDDIVSSVDNGSLKEDNGMSGHHTVHASVAAVGGVLSSLAELPFVDAGAPVLDVQSLDWSTLPPEVDPSAGGVPNQRATRKREQLVSLYGAVRRLATAGCTVADFCSGCGHVGILLAYLMPWSNVLIIENKEQSLQAAVTRVRKLQLGNVTIYQCNLNQFVGAFDVGVALHACGSSTDMVLQRCFDVGAAFVISPCCYGSVRETVQSEGTASSFSLSLPRSQAWKHAGITASSCLIVGHAADQTEFGRALAELGKRCMIAVDADRLAWAEEKNYQVELCTMSPPECSPKNNLLFGSPRRV